MLGVLVFINMFNFIDRQIVSVLLEQIKLEFQVSDEWLGLLTGMAFVLVNASLGLPIARWADRGSRRTIIALGLAIWSSMTALSGLARSFAQLLLLRIGVGLGEAACTPPSHSLISDYFPPERRTSAIAVYNMGANFGILFGLALGGWLQQQFGWRVAFFVVGLPGLAMAVLVRWTLHEPPRGESEGLTDSGEPPTVMEVFRHLASLRSFRHMTAAASLYGLASYGMLTWGPTFLVRVHGLDYADVGLRMGLVVGLGGAAGTLLGGIACDRLARRDVRWQLWLPALASTGMLPFFAVFALAGDTALALAAFLPVNMLNVVFAAPTYALVQGLSTLRMRALASAVILFFLNLVGMGLGPQAVGVLNDLLAPTWGEEAIRYSLMIVLGVNIWGAIHSLLAGRSLRADLEHSRALEAGGSGGLPADRTPVQNGENHRSHE